ncbi:MAG: hypothetical protein ACK6DM_04710 [Alphaproteobacteria bacterium]|jgi:hypothetical protein
MRTRHAALVLLAGVGLLLSTSPTQAVAPEKVEACTTEARSGYARALRQEPSLAPAILTHRKRMSDACLAFLSGKTDATSALTRCLREASAGPVHVQRARNRDTAHVARQKVACRAASDPR